MSNNLQWLPLTSFLGQKETVTNAQRNAIDAAESGAIFVTGDTNVSLSADEVRRALIISLNPTAQVDITLSPTKKLLIISTRQSPYPCTITLGATSLTVPAGLAATLYLDGTPNGLITIGSADAAGDVFEDLVDVPSTLGAPGQPLKVNDSETGLDYAGAGGNLSLIRKSLPTYRSHTRFSGTVALNSTSAGVTGTWFRTSSNAQIQGGYDPGAAQSIISGARVRITGGTSDATYVCQIGVFDSTTNTMTAVLGRSRPTTFTLADQDNQYITFEFDNEIILNIGLEYCILFWASDQSIAFNPKIDLTPTGNIDGVKGFQRFNVFNYDGGDLDPQAGSTFTNISTTWSLTFQLLGRSNALSSDDAITGECLVTQAFKAFYQGTPGATESIVELVIAEDAIITQTAGVSDNAVAYCETAPTSDYALDFKVNGVSVGTLTFLANSNVAEFSGFTTLDLKAEDLVEIVSPASGTISDFSFCMRS